MEMKKIIRVESGSTRSLSVENSLWTCRKTDCVMRYTKWTVQFIL